MAKHLTTLIPIIAFTLLGAGNALAAAGNIDLSFGSDGGAHSLNPLTLPDGRLARVERNESGLYVSMLAANGQPDASYGDAGNLLVPVTGLDNISGVSVHPSTGEILLLIALTRDIDGQSQSVPAVLKLTVHGQPDTAFGGARDGIAVIGPLPQETAGVGVMTVQRDGRILLAGPKAGTNGDSDTCGGSTRLLRLLPDGGVDRSFGADGWAEVADVAAICGLKLLAARADGGIVIADTKNTLRALRADGSLDPGFGDDAGGLPDNVPAWVSVTTLPDDGLMLAGLADGINAIRLVRLTAAGRLDAAFGSGGLIDLDLTGVAPGPIEVSYLPPPAYVLRLAPDGRSLFLPVRIAKAGDPDPICSGVARLSLDGALDPSFGRDGVSCPLPGIDTFLLIQGNGSPLLVPNKLGGDVRMIRLLTEDRPSLGAVMFSSGRRNYEEISDGSGPLIRGTAAGEGHVVTVTVSRVGGSDGATSVDYSTVDFPRALSDNSKPASAGRSYVATSGRLDWADGDVSDRTISLNLIDNDTWDGYWRLRFGLELTAHADDTVIGFNPMAIYILENDPAAPAPTSSSGGGGGCSISWLTLLALTILPAFRRETRIESDVRTRRADAGAVGQAWERSLRRAPDLLVRNG